MLENQNLSLLCGAFLLMALGGTVATAQEAAPERAATDSSCQLFEESCSRNCSALEVRAEAISCLMACARVAASCPTDEPVTLDSERLVAMGLAEGPSAFSSACNPTTPCPPILRRYRVRRPGARA